MIGSTDHRDDIVDRDDIELVVRNFYRDAAIDDVLGPVFEKAHVNWNAHIATLIEFWAWQLLGEPGYEGTPLRTSFDGPRAVIAKGRGRKMAAAMERLLSGVSAGGPAPIEPMWRRAGCG